MIINEKSLNLIDYKTLEKNISPFDVNFYFLNDLLTFGFPMLLKNIEREYWPELA